METHKIKRIKEYNENPKHCKQCNIVLPYEKRKNIFCNKSCSATYNNKGITRNYNHNIEITKCPNCGKEVRGKIYCNQKCKTEFTYKTNEELLLTGNYRYNKTKFAKDYLIEKRGYQCERCKNTEWLGEPIPLELEHKDGDSSNNKLENLELLCPNCHVFTPFYKGRNKGNSKRQNRTRYYKRKNGI